MFTEVTSCRACQSFGLVTILDLGDVPISDFLPSPAAHVDRAPLCLVRCDTCGLAQLQHTVDRNRLYARYHYRSSINETMRAALDDVARSALAHVTLDVDDHVLDIGMNDGYLLNQFPAWTRRVGVDPSDVTRDVVDAGITKIHDFWPLTRYPISVVPCKVITAIAMIYDVDDPLAFLKSVREWLHPEGVFIAQYQSLEDMLECDGVDNICHEHVALYDFNTMEPLLHKAGLRIVDWTSHPINGGSTRIVCRRDDSPLLQPLRDSPAPVSAVDLWDFATRARRARTEFTNFLLLAKAQGKSVHGLAASTKWNTWASWCEIGSDDIASIGDRTPQKHGTWTATGIPVVSEEELRAAKPDVAVVCAWQFFDAIVARERAAGLVDTTFVAALPSLRIDAPRRTVRLIA